MLYCRPLVAKGEQVTAVTDGMPTWYALQDTSPPAPLSLHYPHRKYAPKMDFLIGMHLT